MVSNVEAEPAKNDFDKSSLIKFKGSFYEAVTTPKTYNDHKEYAEQQTLYGQEGGLVNINSEAEQQFLYDKFFILNEKQPSINTNAPSDFWYTGMQKNSDGWVYKYTDHTDPIEYTNWAVNNYTHDASRDIILVSGDSNDGGTSRDRGEWIVGHSQAVSQFYSIIEYPVTIENSIVLNNGKIFTFFDLNDPETNSSEIKYEIQELNGEFIQARLNANTITDGNQTNPKILEFDNGSFVVAWLSNSDGKNGIGYQYFDELGEKIDKEKFVDFSVLPQLNQENISFDLSKSTPENDYYDYSGLSSLNTSGVNQIPSDFIVQKNTTNEAFKINLQGYASNPLVDDNILLQSEFDNTISGKLSGNEDNWVYQFNLPTTSKVNLSILNNDDIMGETYLYKVGGYGHGGKSGGGPEGFKFDGILDAGQYVLRISSSGSETGHHMPPFKDNLVTNFDLKAKFSPFIIGEDKGGNPLPPPSGDHSYIDLGTLHKRAGL